MSWNFAESMGFHHSLALLEANELGRIQVTAADIDFRDNEAEVICFIETRQDLFDAPPLASQCKDTDGLKTRRTL